MNLIDLVQEQLETHWDISNLEGEPTEIYLYIEKDNPDEWWLSTTESDDEECIVEVGTFENCIDYWRQDDITPVLQTITKRVQEELATYTEGASND